MKQRKIFLSENDIPRQWYNILADIKLNPYINLDGQPVSPDALAPVFPMNMLELEMTTQRWIDIPEEVLEVLAIWHPTPLIRAYNLENELKTPAKIYFKDESVSPTGSHKPNTAVAQAYYNKAFGITKLTTETGAGQWGSALSFACHKFGLECEIYMVRISYNQKPYRKILMQTWGATCYPSPSERTIIGREILENNPDSPGSLGIAVSEALEVAVCDSSGKTRYSLGSLLNHVLLQQTIIGLEAKKQFELIGEYPDVVIGCAGGGSNFAGIAYPFVYDKINGKDIEIYPVEPAACPSMTKAPFVYDYADNANYSPLLGMHSLGNKFIPPPIHAGGLRYHGIAPTISQLINEGLITPRAYTQLETFQAGVLWAKTEGVIPAPETNHALACLVEEAIKAKEEGMEKVLLVNFSGHGMLDLSAYQQYYSRELTNFELSEEEINESQEIFKNYPKPEIFKSR